MLNVKLSILISPIKIIKSGSLTFILFALKPYAFSYNSNKFSILFSFDING